LLAKEKMNIPNNESIRLVLECDGTQVEDGEYFRTLPYNTVIMVLRNDQKWYPLNIEALRTGKVAQFHAIYDKVFLKYIFIGY